MGTRIGIYNSNQSHYFTTLKKPYKFKYLFYFEIFKFLYDHRLFNSIDKFLSLSDFDTGT